MKRISYLVAAPALFAMSLFGAPAALAQCTRVAPWIDSGCDPCGVGMRWVGST